MVPLAPMASGPKQSLRPPDFSGDSDSNHSALTGEEFLYHLSRGSELLKENQVQAAKEALELALSLQPMDLRSQGLLGIVYFRLGMYPRAINIYRQIVAVFEHEIPPKVNLALCYLKTGQHQAAREILEDVVQREPEHLRAWAYLGVVFQFQRDFAKAEAAFARAGQHHQAERMRLLARDEDPQLADAMIPEVSWEVRAAAREACEELSSATEPFRLDARADRNAEAALGCWCATEPGEEPTAIDIERVVRRRSSPPPALPSKPAADVEFTSRSGPDSSNTPTQLHRGGASGGWPDNAITAIQPDNALTAKQADVAVTLSEARHLEDMPTPIGVPVEQPQRADRLSLAKWLGERRAGSRVTTSADATRSLWLDLAEPFAVKATGIVALSPSELGKREIRIVYRSPTNDVEEVLGGAQSPIIGLLGPGKLMAQAQHGILEVFELRGEAITVRHELLFGLSLALNYDFERIRLMNDLVDAIHLYGCGLVALNLPQPARTVEARADGLLVRSSELCGWTSPLQPLAVDPAEAPGRSRGFLVLRGAGTAILT